MANGDTPAVKYNETRPVRPGVFVRYKLIYPADPERYPPGACYSLHYGVDPALAPDDVAWPIGEEQGTMLRYDNDHGDGTHHRHVGGNLDHEYSFPGSVATVYDRFWGKSRSNRSDHPRRTTTHDRRNPQDKNARERFR